jgi:hypothetical protein
MSIQALGPTQRPMQLVLVVSFPKVRCSVREVEYLFPSSAEVYNEWSYYYPPHIRVQSVGTYTVIFEKYSVRIRVV